VTAAGRIIKGQDASRRVTGLLLLFYLLAPLCHAQISFTSAIALALRNSPRVKAAQNDVQKAQSGLAVMKDIYIPSVVTSIGLGDAYGITLGVPTIFTVNAQSLIYSAQQRAYIRGARFDLQAATLALAEARAAVEEDTAITYISLDNAQKAVETLSEQYGMAMKLLDIVQDRVNANLDSDLELMKARRGAVQIKLQQLQSEDDLEGTRMHLAQLTGLSADDLVTVPESIPSLPSVTSLSTSLNRAVPDSPGILAADANAKAKQQRARGDAQYTWRPLITFGAQYGRISPINDVSNFYNLHGNYNTANIGIQIQFPLLDKVRKAAAQQSFLDASRAVLDLDGLRFDQGEGRRKLERSLPELAARAELADLDFSIAQKELDSTIVQLHASPGGSALTPKEEQTARIQERQRYLDLLDAQLQLRKAQFYLLRQAGQLESWIESQIGSASTRQ
jgi:outer membrane protein TolC